MADVFNREAKSPQMADGLWGTENRIRERVEYWRTQKALGLPVDAGQLFEVIDELLGERFLED